jgi:hypothetical protein
MPDPRDVSVAPLHFEQGLAFAEQPLYRAGLCLGHRMTVIRLAEGGLVLHSPIEWSEALAAELERHGPIRAILVPSLMHDLWLAPWFEQYPEAERLGPIAIQKPHPKLEFSHWLEEHPDLLAPELPALRLEGMPRVQEWVFWHRASRTLIAADLLFDRPRGHKHVGKLLARFAGLHKGPTVSRIFRSFIQDRAAFLASLQRILEADWDRLVIGHGAPIESGAKSILRAAFGLEESSTASSG